MVQIQISKKNLGQAQQKKKTDEMGHICKKEKEKSKYKIKIQK